MGSSTPWNMSYYYDIIDLQFFLENYELIPDIYYDQYYSGNSDKADEILMSWLGYDSIKHMGCFSVDISVDREGYFSSHVTSPPPSLDLNVYRKFLDFVMDDVNWKLS